MKSMVHCWWSAPALVVWGTVAWGTLYAAEGAPLSAQVEVSAELERLMSEHGFEVRGIEQTQDALGHASGENLVTRVDALLEDFDHIIIQSPSGGIERVIILGEKVAYVPPAVATSADGGPQGADTAADGEEIVLATSRKGASHLVTLTLEGIGGQKTEEPLLIDTGADQVVLPMSLMSTLGFSGSLLHTQPVQTANGPVEAHIGKLPAIWLNETRIEDVDVAFIDDQSLGGNSLLGMSLLGRFRMTIDDEKSQLTLAFK